MFVVVKCVEKNEPELFWGSARKLSLKDHAIAPPAGVLRIVEA